MEAHNMNANITVDLVGKHVYTIKSKVLIYQTQPLSP